METLALKFLPRNKQLEYRYHFFFSSGKSELFETGYSNIQKTISASLFTPLKSVSLKSVMQFLGLHSSIRNSTTGTLPNCFLGWVSCSILCLSKCQVISELFQKNNGKIWWISALESRNWLNWKNNGPFMH